MHTQAWGIVGRLLGRCLARRDGSYGASCFTDEGGLFVGRHCCLGLPAQ